MHPYTVNKETGRGAAWGRSLCEYGYGMALASLQRRKRSAVLVQDYVNENDSDTNEDVQALVKSFDKWIKSCDNLNENNKICNDLDESQLISKVARTASPASKIKIIYNQRDMFRLNQNG